MFFSFFLLFFFFIKSRSNEFDMSDCDYEKNDNEVIGDFDIESNKIYCIHLNTKGLIIFGQNVTVWGEYKNKTFEGEEEEFQYLEEKENAYGIHFSTNEGIAKFSSINSQRIFLAQFNPPGIYQIPGTVSVSFNFSTDIYINNNITLDVDVYMNSTIKQGRLISFYNPQQLNIKIKTDKNSKGVADLYPSGSTKTINKNDVIQFTCQSTMIQLIPDPDQFNPALNNTLKGHVQIVVNNPTPDLRLPLLESRVDSGPTVLAISSVLPSNPTEENKNIVPIVVGVVVAVVVIVAIIIVVVILRFRRKSSEIPDSELSIPDISRPLN